MDILLLNETEVQSLLDPDALLDQLSEGFRALSSGLVEAPKRNGVSVPNSGFLLAMPAYQQGRAVTVKLVSVFPENQRLGLPTHQALICLFDPETGTVNPANLLHRKTSAKTRNLVGIGGAGVKPPDGVWGVPNLLLFPKR